ncbi:hypothetical protein COX58_02840 [archaeon CG_4_10_14_0_2_um_filter_Archaea_38_6]|nr:MAG: hypothetical protein COS83_05130 [archaeon CG07_land_8_20_14_0_80_38_8]PIU88321.1 MAG: hypothetical protein COS64_04070 [archaeon CG06_land_8_20_14_3_00_37_11]PJA22083.1 MAG: hypothetical protein COX58_02840 [archaeon CG_4_10_14_0_2_um_filter_Archaea_38_6]
MSELEKIIEKEQKNSKDIYNFISEEFRRMASLYMNGTPLINDENRIAYKKLFYNCYKVIADYLKENRGIHKFSWDKYNICLKKMGESDKGFMDLKLAVKDEICQKINSIIDQSAEKNPEKKRNSEPYVENPRLAFTFSIISYNILTNFEFARKRKENSAEPYWI